MHSSGCSGVKILLSFKVKENHCVKNCQKKVKFHVSKWTYLLEI